MNAEILAFTGIAKVEEPPASTLEKAKAWDMERCIVLGWREDGTFCMGSSFADMGGIVLLLRAAEHHLMMVKPKVWGGP